MIKLRVENNRIHCNSGISVIHKNVIANINVSDDILFVVDLGNLSNPKDLFKLSKMISVIMSITISTQQK